ncbi:Arc family DNA-binding protein [bacterium]|nr:Arc family DNA-binding protein [bacterium]
MDKQDEKVFTLRLSRILFEKIKKEAESNKRSITKHIEFILEKSLEK